MTEGDTTMAFLRRAVVALLVVLCSAGAHVASAAVVDPDLSALIASSAPTDTLGVIVTFDGDAAPTPDHVGLLRTVGITQGLMLRSLPMAGVLADPAQIEALAQSSSVVCVYANKELEYFNAAEREITGVDRARTEPQFRTPDGMPL